MKKIFIAYFYFNGLANISLGASVCFSQPNFELHVPFGFFRIGWEQDWKQKRFGFLSVKDNPPAEAAWL